jgi:hypothetical protein
LATWPAVREFISLPHRARALAARQAAVTMRLRLDSASTASTSTGIAPGALAVCGCEGGRPRPAVLHRRGRIARDRRAW